MAAPTAREQALFPTLTDEQIARLAEFGAEVQLAVGDTVFVEGEPIQNFDVVLEGELRVVKRTDAGDAVMAVHKPREFTGEISLLAGGMAPVTGYATVPTRVLRLDRLTLLRLIGECSPVADILIPAMARRLQDIGAVTGQRERLAALGKLSAGLAHELNNPAAAAARAAGQLREALAGQHRLGLALHALALTAEQWAWLADLQGQAPPALDPLAQSDAEDALAGWLDEHGVDDGWRLAPTLVGAGLTVETLRELPGTLDPGAVSPLLSYLEATLSARALAAEIEASAQRISTLVKAVKEYTYMDQAPLQQIDLHQGLENTLTILHHKLKHGITVRREYDRSLPRIMAYGSELNQVWTNIIDNAIDAMGGKGTLTIRTCRDGECAVVEIMDSGPGMPPEVQSRIFEPFFTTKGVGEGTGMGLDISFRIIVTHHHGDIAVCSQPGDTRFTIHLPLNNGGAT